MCEANVYAVRDGAEALVMEKVDRVVPGDDNQLFLENIFGERRVIKARIREMELVHHRILIDEIVEDVVQAEQEIWLDLVTDHGHFHGGDDVRLQLMKGINMTAEPHASFHGVEAFVVKDGIASPVQLSAHHGAAEINLGQEADGLLTIYAHEKGQLDYYGKIVVEIGHHHHHGMQPAGLPLEIVPKNYSHVHMGDQYEVQVLKNGAPLAGALVKATYANNHGRQYPHRLTTDDDGRARVFLTAKGNWLFSVQDDNVISTFTLVKSF